VGAAEALGSASNDRGRRSGGVFTHIAVPRPKHAPALVRQPLVPDDVALRIGVLPAVPNALALPPRKRVVARTPSSTYWTLKTSLPRCISSAAQSFRLWR
jgi:hypothetical protein